MYAPLEFMAQSPCPNRELEVKLQMLSKAANADMTDITEDEYIDFFFTSFLTSSYFKNNPKLQLFSKVLNFNLPYILKQTNIDIKDYESHKFDAYTEMRDLYLAPILFDKWGRNKQVYKPDPDFAEALLNTELLQIYKSQMTRLPFNTFYVDLESCSIFSPIIGAFVNVINKNNETNFAVYLLEESATYFFSYYCGGTYNADGFMKMGEMPEREYEIVDFDNRKVLLNHELTRSAVTMFVLQFICYLSSKRPEITDEPVTKSTYKQSTVVRNRFSEIQAHEVGIRYGSVIREQKEKIRKDEEESKEEEHKKQTGSSKPKAAHWRRAHWHHYWTGEGRTVREVRWIEPVFVDSLSSKEFDVVIHPVKN